MKYLNKDKRNAPSNDCEGESHTSPMALIEMMLMIINRDFSRLDYDGEWASEDNIELISAHVQRKLNKEA